MLQKKEIETMMAVNGLSPNATNEEVMAMLQRTGYDQAEINLAMTMFRGNEPVSPEPFEKVQHKLLLNESLKPGEVSALLGIEVGVELDEKGSYKKKRQDVTVGYVLAVSLLAILFVSLALFTAMYLNKMGPFQESISSA